MHQLAATWLSVLWIYAGIRAILSTDSFVPYEAWSGGTVAALLVAFSLSLFGGPAEKQYGLTQIEQYLVAITIFAGVVRYIFGRVWAVRAFCTILSHSMVKMGFSFMSPSATRLGIASSIYDHRDPHQSESCQRNMLHVAPIAVLLYFLEMRSGISVQVSADGQQSARVLNFIVGACGFFTLVLSYRAFGLLSFEMRSANLHQPKKELSGPGKEIAFETPISYASIVVILLSIMVVGFVNRCAFAATSLLAAALLVAQAMNHLGPSESIYFSRLCTFATSVSIVMGIPALSVLLIQSHPRLVQAICAIIAAVMASAGFAVLSRHSNEHEGKSPGHILGYLMQLELSELLSWDVIHIVLGFSGVVVSLHFAYKILQSSASTSSARLLGGGLLSFVLVLNAVDRLGAAESPSSLSALGEGLSYISLLTVLLPTFLTQSPPWLLSALCTLLSLHMVGAGASYLSPRGPADGAEWYPRARSAITMGYLFPVLGALGLSPGLLGELVVWVLVVAASLVSWAFALLDYPGLSKGSHAPAGSVASFLMVLHALLLFGPSERAFSWEHLYRIDFVFAACAVPPLMLSSIALCLPMIGFVISAHTAYLGFAMLGSQGEASYLVAGVYAVTLVLLAAFSAARDREGKGTKAQGSLVPGVSGTGANEVCLNVLLRVSYP
jgi:hypothetical protein